MTSSTGLSSVFVELDYGTDLDAARQDLGSGLSSLTGLPEGVEPEVLAGSIDDFPVIQISVSSPDDLEAWRRRSSPTSYRCCRVSTASAR